MTIFSPSDPINNQPYLATTGLQISNDPITPNTLIDIGPGLTRDSTNTFDINLGNWFGEIPSTSAGTSLVNGFQTAQAGVAANTTTVINGAINGPLGLDQGTLAASSLYYIFVIFDATGKLQPSAIISLSLTAPVLPAGYSNFHWIGQMRTDASTHFLLGYNYGTKSDRLFFYDAPLATSVTAGASATYAQVNLIGLVPNINNIPVWITTNFTPGAAGDTLSLQPGNGTGAPVVITGQVSTVHVISTNLVMAQQVLVGGVLSPVINYKVSGTDTVAISVLGYQYSL
jgi:hypothetical protein